MAETRISDVIKPEIFTPYVQLKTAELSAFFSSGIVQEDSRIALGMRVGGETVNMPYWNDLSGEEEALSDQKSLTVNAITAGQDIAVVQALGKAWGANDLAHTLSGDDPMRAIGDSVAGFWARALDARLISTLKGAMSATKPTAGGGMTGNVHNISALSAAKAIIDKNTFADAAFKLGDAYASLSGIAVHSATYAKLVKDDLISTVRGADGVPFDTYQGKRVIVSDNLPRTSAGVYTSYLFGAGAFAYAEGTPKMPVEFDRNSLAGYDVMINRRHIALHLRGVKWIGSANISTGDNSSGHPTRAELATAANYQRVYENKQIRCVAFIHKIA